MPRDLTSIAKENTIEGMPQLTKSPEEVEVEDHSSRAATADALEERPAAMDAEDEDDMVASMGQQESNSKRDEVHPYTQSLSVSDVESCTRLEEECFPPNERCTREKVRTRVVVSLSFRAVPQVLALLHNNRTSVCCLQ